MTREDDIKHKNMIAHLMFKNTTDLYIYRHVPYHSFDEINSIEIMLYSRIYKLYYIDDIVALISYNGAKGMVGSDYTNQFNDIVESYNLTLIKNSIDGKD